MKNPTAAPTKFRKILFAVEGSPHSAAATGTVAALAARSGAKVQVLHVWNLEIRADRGRWDVETRPEARQLVERIAKQLADRGVAVTTELRTAPHDKIAEGIALAAAEYGADLVALGSHGRSDLGALLLGSVSHRVLGLVRCPVLVARPGKDRQPRGEIKRLLLAVAGGDEVPHALEAAAAVALGAGAEVRVLHVRYLASGEGGAWVEPDEDAAAVVNGVVSQLRAAGVVAEGRVAGPSSFVAHDIARAADEWDADLIVIGSRRLSELGGLLASSVSHEVIHVADRPVLVAEVADRGDRT